MAFLTDFVVEASAGLVGVFAGVILALWSERKRRGYEEERQATVQEQELTDIRGSILSSVVRNTSESKRLVALLSDRQDLYLFGASFETAVWQATHEQFFRLASLDERVGFTRFFDQVQRVVRLIEFHRTIQAQIELRETRPDAGDHQLLKGVSARLNEVAEDVRLDGVVLVADHGTTMHKRLLGLQSDA